MGNENTKIWDEVERTDPRFTKDFNRSGGFKGTAINPTYIARKLTEQFGPCGFGWGYSVVREEYVKGGPIQTVPTEIRKEGETSVYQANEIIYGVTHVVLVEFWYMHPDTAEPCKIYQYGQTTYVGKDKNGLFTDEEAPKKSITDGWTKAATLLGTSADIYLGGHGFGDNKYVNAPKAEAIEAEVVPAAGVAELTMPKPEASAPRPVPTPVRQAGPIPVRRMPTGGGI